MSLFLDLSFERACSLWRSCARSLSRSPSCSHYYRVLQYGAACCSELYRNRDTRYGRMLQYGAILRCVAVCCTSTEIIDTAVCCSVLQCVAVCCSVLQCAAPQQKYSIRPYVAVRCSVMQCGAVCWSVLQCIAVCCSVLHLTRDTRCISTAILDAAVCCSTVQCGAMCCSVLQCVAVCCSVLHLTRDTQCISTEILDAAVCCSTVQCVGSVLQCAAPQQRYSMWPYISSAVDGPCCKCSNLLSCREPHVQQQPTHIHNHTIRTK